MTGDRSGAVGEETHSEIAHALDFICELEWNDLPRAVQHTALYLLRDFAAVSYMGRAAPPAQIAAEFATRSLAGDGATILATGARASSVGAAFANGTLANALDFDDGHNGTRGHPGAVVLPAILAVGESSSIEEIALLAVIGYELAIRAGLWLDTRRHADERSASGFWAALGASAAVSRALSFDRRRTMSALSAAEYYGPVSPIMRNVERPAMSKDACGWGSLVAVASAQLAEYGFTSTESMLLGRDGLQPADLGSRWLIEEVYVKPYPCCRWTQPAVRAALDLQRDFEIDPWQIEAIEINTFDAASKLPFSLPHDTDSAQYSLVWPVAVALRKGAFTVGDVLEAGLADELSRLLVGRTNVQTDPAYDKAFPNLRLTDVRVVMRDGTVHGTHVESTPGDHGDLNWEEIIDEKARVFEGPMNPSTADADLLLQRLADGPCLLNTSRGRTS